MGTSKAKKNQRNTNSKTAAAKQRRRADRKAKSSPALTWWDVTIPFPVWQYPDLADEMVEQDPTRTYNEALVILLAHPVLMSKDGAPPEPLDAIRAITEKGSSGEAFIGGFEDMHRDGILEWNPVTRVHHIDSKLAALQQR